MALLFEFGVADGIELFRQLGECDLAQSADQQPFGSIQRIRDCAVDDPFDRAGWIVVVQANREDMTAADCPMNIQQGRFVEVAGNRPAAPLSSDRSNIAVGAQASHGPTNDNGVRLKHSGDMLGCIWAIMAGHVQQDVEHAGQAAVGSHDALREMSAEPSFL